MWKRKTTRKAHWERVYATMPPTKVGWYQANPTLSLEFIAATGITRTQKIIDVGGGAALLVDRLLDEGYEAVTLLEISAGVIAQAKERLGIRAEQVTWIEADVTDVEFSDHYDLWHDRAVFHFLTDPGDRKKYVAALNRGLHPGDHLVIATFGMDGPKKCSGLNIIRYSPQTLSLELGDNFKLIKSMDELHVTPSKRQQKFMYCHFQKRPD